MNIVNTKAYEWFVFYVDTCSDVLHSTYLHIHIDFARRVRGF